MHFKYIYITNLIQNPTIFWQILNLDKDDEFWDWNKFTKSKTINWKILLRLLQKNLIAYQNNQPQQNKKDISI